MTREEAITILNMVEAHGSLVVKAKDMAIKALEQEPCDDCISREDARQFLYERIDRLNDDELYDIFSRIIDYMYNELPSVKPQYTEAEIQKIQEMEQAEIQKAYELGKAEQQKTGRWIDVENEEMEMVGYYCSECDLPMETEQRTNFCPNCGAKMESEGEEV